MKEKRNNLMRNGISVYGIVVGIILFLYSVSLLVPLLWGVMTSLKSDLNFMIDPFGLPEEWKFSNYIEAMDRFVASVRQADGSYRNVYIEEMLLYSVFYAGLCALVATISPCVMAYVSSKYKYKFSKVIETIVVVTLLIPQIGTTPSMLVVTRSLKIYDTVIGMLLLKSGFLGLYFMVFHSAFKNLSWEYAEAALIDGAGHFRIMTTIMIPLIRTIFMAVWLMYFIQFWNDYQTIMVYFPSKPTLAYGMYKYSFDNKVSSVTMQVTGCMFLILPIFILFLFLRNKLLGNMTIGGIKG